MKLVYKAGVWFDNLGILPTPTYVGRRYGVWCQGLSFKDVLKYSANTEVVVEDRKRYETKAAYITEWKRW